MRRVVNPKFWMGDIVVHRLDPDERGLIVSVTCLPDDRYNYNVVWASGREGTHFAIELIESSDPREVRVGG